MICYILYTITLIHKVSWFTLVLLYRTNILYHTNHMHHGLLIKGVHLSSRYKYSDLTIITVIYISFRFTGIHCALFCTKYNIFCFCFLILIYKIGIQCIAGYIQLTKRVVFSTTGLYLFKNINKCCFYVHKERYVHIPESFLST